MIKLKLLIVTLEKMNFQWKFAVEVQFETVGREIVIFRKNEGRSSILPTSPPQVPRIVRAVLDCDSDVYDDELKFR